MQPNCQSCFSFPFLLSAGTKHKTMLEARNGSGTIKAFPRAGVKGKGPVNKGNTGLQNKTFHCEICDVHVNSETQLKQVLSQLVEWESLVVLRFHGGKVPTVSTCQYNSLCPNGTYSSLHCTWLPCCMFCFDYDFPLHGICLLKSSLNCTHLVKSYSRCKLHTLQLSLDC